MTIRGKMLSLNLVLVAVPLIAVFAWGIAYFANDKRTYIDDLNSTVAQQLASDIDGRVSRLREQIVTLVGLYTDTQLQPEERERQMQALFQRMQEVLGFALHLGDAQRAKLLKSAALPDAEARLKGALERRPGPAAVRLFNATETPALPLLALHEQVQIVSERGGTETLYAAMAMRPDAVAVIDALGASQRAALVDAGGDVLASPDPEWAGTARSLREHPIVKSFLEDDARIRSNVRTYEHEGRTMLGAYARLGGGLGAVIIESPEAVALEPVRRLVRSTIFALAAILLVAIITGVWFSRSITDPLQNLVGAAGQIAKGRFTVTVDTNARDEVGDLGRAFKAMQEGLITRDTEIEQAHAQLVQSEKMASLGQMAAGITHEVKNPMAGIIGFAQLGLMQAPADSPVREYFQTIEKEGKRAKDILENLLRFARKEDAKLQKLLVNDVVAEALKLVGHQLRINKVNVETHFGLDVPEILGSPNQLQQVLMNLFINAQHAMSTGGMLTVSTSRVDGRALIAVKDTGSGMTPEVKARLFEPFFTTKEKGKGTGLGLSVSYGIVQTHGGRIAVDSKVGEGTTFRIELPDANTMIEVLKKSEPPGARPPA